MNAIIQIIDSYSVLSSVWSFAAGLSVFTTNGSGRGEWY